MRWHIDKCTDHVISGWFDNDGPLESVAIFVNGNHAVDIKPHVYRKDLDEAGIGDGCRSFVTTVAEHLNREQNIVEFFFEGRRVDCKMVSVDDPGSADYRKLKLLRSSKRRWKGDEEAHHLTWGVMLSGDELWRIYMAHHEFQMTDRILEIGPGYGRILAAQLDCGIPYAKYVGVELSAARTESLRREFRSEKISFSCADINHWGGDEIFDIVISSSTFEHLYPDFSRALENVKGHLAMQGKSFIDFIDGPSQRAFEPVGGAFVRGYSDDELFEIYERCELKIHAIEKCRLGTTPDGTPIDRKVVFATAS